MKHLNVEAQWELYLKRGGVKKEQLGETQYTEMKRAFYAAWGQCMILMRDDISELPEDQGVQRCEIMLNQVKRFWEGGGY